MQRGGAAATTFTVNRREVRVDVDPRTPLVMVLRNELGLTGVRTGCGIGECGVCTVGVTREGEPPVAVRACDVALEVVSGADLTTAEGLGGPDAPGEVQAAFLTEQAAQCGYCINGMIMRTHVELARGADAGEIMACLEEHLCRCGTHGRIARAVLRAAGEPMEGPVTEVQTPAALPSPDEARPPGVGLPVSTWLRPGPDGRVEVLLGKVEIGQGIRTALAQTVAASAGLRMEDLVLHDVTTGQSPDEGYTASSRSLMQGGVALAWAGAALRRQLVERAAEQVGCDAADLDLQGGVLVRRGGADDRQLPSLPALLAQGPLDGAVTPSDRPSWTGAPLGESLPRTDLLAKLTGAPAFIHDLQLPGMVHARTVLPPGQHARLAEVEDADAIRGAEGVIDVVRDGDLLAVIADDEATAVRAARQLADAARWDDPGLAVEGRDLVATLRTLPSQRHVARAAPADGPAIDLVGDGDGLKTVTATYTCPSQLHASVAPSCALARWEESGHLAVVTHSQGPYPLRAELAVLLDIPEDEVEVRHHAGAGCYGHNMADDAAGIAALIARAVPGRWVRLAFSVEEEFTWEPQGSAMAVDVSATSDARGRVTSWRHRALTDTHVARPIGTGDRLIASWLRQEGSGPEWPGPHAGGARNGVPLYDIPHLEVVADHVDGPVRTSALRTLGAFVNTFASESFIDELAETAGEDPVAFRLAHLTDPRARAVLETAAEAAEWRRRVGPSGYGQGVALTRYKGEAAYVAVVVRCQVDPTGGGISVQEVTLACDAGVVVNPDGLRNQLEGGVLQGLSRTLLEAVELDAGGQRSRDWTSYPVLRFSAVPPVRVILLDRPGHPPLGAGEAATPPIPAAVASAVDDATGIRLRSLPFTAEQIERRLFAMDEQEAARVLA